MKSFIVAALILISQVATAQSQSRPTQMVTSRCDAPRDFLTGNTLYGSGLHVVNNAIADEKPVYVLERLVTTPNAVPENLGTFRMINENYTSQVYQIPNSSYYLYASKENPGQLVLIDALSAIKVECQVAVIKGWK